MNITRNVPCNGCYLCCVSEAIFIHPKCGDQVNDYEVERYNGRLMLKHKDNGDCVYLDRKIGCTIHGKAPTICRGFDCRKIYKKIKYNSKLLAMVPKGTMDKAKSLLKGK